MQFLIIVVLLAVIALAFEAPILAMVRRKDPTLADDLADALAEMRISGGLAVQRLVNAIVGIIERVLPPILRVYGWVAFGLFLAVAIGGYLMAYFADAVEVGAYAVFLPGIVCAWWVLRYLLSRVTITPPLAGSLPGTLPTYSYNLPWIIAVRRPNAIRRVLLAVVPLATLYGLWITLVVSAWIHKGHGVNNAYGMLRNGRPFVALGFLLFLFAFGTISVIVTIGLKLAETLTDYLEGTTSYVINFVKAVFVGGNAADLAEAFATKINIADQETFQKRWKDIKQGMLAPALLLYLLPQIWPDYAWNAGTLILSLSIAITIIWGESMKVAIKPETREFIFRCVFWVMIIIFIIQTIFFIWPSREMWFDLKWTKYIADDGLYNGAINTVWPWFVSLTMFKWWQYGFFIFPPLVLMVGVQKVMKDEKGTVAVFARRFLTATAGAFLVMLVIGASAKMWRDWNGGTVMIVIDDANKDMRGATVFIDGIKTDKFTAGVLELKNLSLDKQHKIRLQKDQCNVVCLYPTFVDDSVWMTTNPVLLDKCAAGAEPNDPDC